MTRETVDRYLNPSIQFFVLSLRASSDDSGKGTTGDTSCVLPRDGMQEVEGLHIRGRKIKRLKFRLTDRF